MKRLPHLEFETHTMPPLIPIVTIPGEEVDPTDMLKMKFARDYNLDDPENLKLRAKCFAQDFNFPREITYLDAKELRELPEDVHYFPQPKNGELNMLLSSIETHGILMPLVVMKEEMVEGETKYYIIDGRTRKDLSMHLYRETGLETYRNLPCFVIDGQGIDEYKLKSLVIDLNLAYKNVPMHVKTYALIERCEILKATKQYRNEMNVAEEVFNKHGISRSTLFTYVRLKNLSPQVLKLFADGRLKLKSALMLTNTSHEYQELLIRKYGVDILNDSHMMSYIGDRDMSEEKLEKMRYKVLCECHVNKVKFSLSIKPRYAHMVFNALKDVLLQMVRDYKSSFKKKFFSLSFTETLRNIENIPLAMDSVRILREKNLKVLLAKALE